MAKGQKPTDKKNTKSPLLYEVKESSDRAICLRSFDTHPPENPDIVAVQGIDTLYLRSDNLANEHNKKQIILVTGCAGFIGSRIAELLLERGDTVVGVDNLNDAYPPPLKEWRLGRSRNSRHLSLNDWTSLTSMRSKSCSNNTNSMQ